MSQAADGVSYEGTNPSKYCTGSDLGIRSANRPGCGIRHYTTSASTVGRSGRTSARSRICLDGRLLEVGPRTQGEKRIRVGAGQVETAAAFGCSLGFTKLAFQPWRLHFRWWPLALTGGKSHRRSLVVAAPSDGGE